MSVDDMADVVDGPLKGRSGTVKHIMRGFLFIQTREVAENAGFICLQARHTKVGVGAGAGGVARGAQRHAAGMVNRFASQPHSLQPPGLALCGD